MISIIVLFLLAISTEAKKNRISAPRRKEPPHFESDPMGEPRTFQRPVPFGHIFREGFEDPNAPEKQPLDALELDTVYLKDSYLTREVIEKLKKDFQVIERAESIDAKKYKIEQPYRGNLPEPRPRSNVSRSYWNMALIQQKNMYDPPKRRLGYQRSNNPEPATDLPTDNKGKAEYFSKGKFSLNENDIAVNDNFTTCDTFGRNALFHPDDIVEIVWVPFYIWTSDIMGRVMTSKVHKFSHPTQKLVRKYSEEFGGHLNKSIDWEQPKLVMRQDMLEMLLIAVDRKGLFDGIPYNPIPESMKNSGIKLPIVSIRLKIVDPYLAMMYCDDKYATIMAVAGSEPRTIQNKIIKAAAAKVVGPGHPVERDINMEAMVINAQSKDKMFKELDKFINAADQMKASRYQDRSMAI